jgi:hypothetical protein
LIIRNNFTNLFSKLILKIVILYYLYRLHQIIYIYEAMPPQIQVTNRHRTINSFSDSDCDVYFGRGCKVNFWMWKLEVFIGSTIILYKNYIFISIKLLCDNLQYWVDYMPKFSEKIRLKILEKTGLSY